MKIYHYDPSTLLLVGTGLADQSPLETDVYLIPANATGVAPPEFDPATHLCCFIDDAWQLIAIPPPDTDLVSEPPTLEQLKAVRIAEINGDCEKAIAEITAGYPASEVLSWPKQEAEARAYMADSSSATPLLTALSQARSISRSDLAARVIVKADVFAALSGSLIGKRQTLEDALLALSADATAEQVAAIVWST